MNFIVKINLVIHDMKKWFVSSFSASKNLHKQTGFLIEDWFELKTPALIGLLLIF